MRQPRFHRRKTGWLGLFALALQLVLSFGHVHATGIAPPHAQLCSLAEHTACPDSGGDQPAGDDTHCAICAVLHLIGSSALPAADPLPVPVAYAPVECAYGVATVWRWDDVHFQARAPPTI